MHQDKALARTVAEIAGRHGNDPSRLLSILLDVQQAAGAVSPAAVEALADALQVPRTRITAVAGFYAFFHAEPRGDYHILFSDNITDHLLGKADLMAYLCRKLWVEPGKLSEDGLVYVDNTSCTGLCDQGPAALIESLEGRRGRPRNRPPYPDTRGYLDRPTVVNNVETLAAAAQVLVHGAAAFAAIGTAQSAGTKLLSVSGDCERPGVYEYPFGVTVREVLDECGAAHPQAVQVSGPSGTCVSWKEFERRIAFEDLPTAGAFMVFDRSRDMFQVARNFAHFFAHESCGFCTPCRVGTALLRQAMDKIHDGRGTAYEMNEMRRLAHILETMSHCGLGHTAANPVVQTMEKFPDSYKRKLKDLSFEPGFDLDRALETARLVTGRRDPGAHLEGKP